MTLELMSLGRQQSPGGYPQQAGISRGRTCPLSALCFDPDNLWPGLFLSPALLSHSGPALGLELNTKSICDRHQQPFPGTPPQPVDSQRTEDESYIGQGSPCPVLPPVSAPAEASKDTSGFQLVCWALFRDSVTSTSLVPNPPVPTVTGVPLSHGGLYGWVHH